MNLAELKKPFPPEAVKWRVGSTTKDKLRGLALAYIDARDVMDRLDEVCGAEWWGTHYEAIAGRVVCTIAIRVPMRVPHPLGPDVGGPDRIEYAWTKKSDGAGDTDYEPEKGGLSDAFKRAAVQWGVGRYLYDIPATWVKLADGGKQIDATELPKLRRLLSGNTPQSALDAPGRATATTPVQDSPKPSAPSGGASDADSEAERFKATLAKITNIGDLARLDSWFARNGAKRFGSFASELADALQARLEELRG